MGQELLPSCMRYVNFVCRWPVCGLAAVLPSENFAVMKKYYNTLCPGTVLQGKNSYRIDRVLGQGAFGITYLAYTTVTVEGALGRLQTEVQVAVKEFFMSDINGREGNTVTTGGSSWMFDNYRRKFAREAANLAKLNHRGIVKVIEIFEDNDTSYYAMEYCGGGSLDDRIKATGGLPVGEAMRYFYDIARALFYMHYRRMLHLDLKPGNVVLRTNGDAVIIDFGLSKQFNEKGEPESSTTLGNGTVGYAPIEQANYNEEDRGCKLPVTIDVYALGATLYKMLTGERPPSSSDVFIDGFPEQPLRDHNVASLTIEAICHAMQPKPTDRTQSVWDFAVELDFPSWDFERIAREQKDTEPTEPEVVLIGYEPEEPQPTPKPQPQPTPKPRPKPAHKQPKRQQIGLPEIEMVYVEGGTFTMGATDGKAKDREKPAHRVTLDSFSIGKFLVTQRLWKAVMGSNPSHFKGNNLPVERVSWKNVQEFLQKLNALTGKNYRLPTEAEWEFAARGGNSSCSYRYSGSNNVDDVAWHWHNSRNSTHGVGAKAPNELGIYDMSGNVAEWCQDWYGSYSSLPQYNPIGPVSGTSRVIRGGSWNYSNVGVSDRDSGTPGICRNTLGFRLAL